MKRKVALASFKKVFTPFINFVSIHKLTEYSMKLRNRPRRDISKVKQEVSANDFNLRTARSPLINNKDTTKCLKEEKEEKEDDASSSEFVGRSENDPNQVDNRLERVAHINNTGSEESERLDVEVKHEATTKFEVVSIPGNTLAL